MVRIVAATSAALDDRTRPRGTECCRRTGPHRVWSSRTKRGGCSSCCATRRAFIHGSPADERNDPCRPTSRDAYANLFEASNIRAMLAYPLRHSTWAALKIARSRPLRSAHLRHALAHHAGTLGHTLRRSSGGIARAALAPK